MKALFENKHHHRSLHAMGRIDNVSIKQIIEKWDDKPTICNFSMYTTWFLVANPLLFSIVALIFYLPNSSHIT